jgi:hypothetical protein
MSGMKDEITDYSRGVTAILDSRVTRRYLSIVFIECRRCPRMVTDFCVSPGDGHVMMRCTSITALLILSFTASVRAQTLDSALAYFPMSIGDTWEYGSWWGMTAPTQFQGYGFSGITGDTIMPNGKVYRVLRWGVDPSKLLINPSYYRVDSSTANIYSYSPISGQESLWDSLRSSVRDHNQWGRVEFVINDIVLGTPTVTKVSGTIYNSYDISYGFGKTREYTETVFQEAYLDRLVYAKINDKEYGTILGIAPTALARPVRFDLLQNYPNPFNPSTIIRYDLPSAAVVNLTVYSVLGQEVANLVNDTEEAGYHDVRFDGSGLASGVYFYRLRASDYVATKKLLLLH